MPTLVRGTQEESRREWKEVSLCSPPDVWQTVAFEAKSIAAVWGKGADVEGESSWVCAGFQRDAGCTWSGLYPW